MQLALQQSRFAVQKDPAGLQQSVMQVPEKQLALQQSFGPMQAAPAGEQTEAHVPVLSTSREAKVAEPLVPGPDPFSAVTRNQKNLPTAGISPRVEPVVVRVKRPWSQESRAGLITQGRLASSPLWRRYCVAPVTGSHCRHFFWAGHHCRF